MSETSGQERGWVPLSPRERRVVGVLVEKQKTTPEYYPMTVAGIVSGCNQKSNREPTTSYDADDVEETLHALRGKGAVVMYEGTGRAPKWKHTLYDWLGLKNRPVELAVLAELLLRGPQTEGELRTRASRMDQIPDLDALTAVLEYLEERGLVVRLSPPEQRRGVIVTHGMYPPEELERVRAAQKSVAVVEDDEPRRAGGGARGDSGQTAEIAALRADLEGLKAEVARVSGELNALRSALGVDGDGG